MKIKFVPQDCWIGLYWKVEYLGYRKWKATYYLCILPCLPIIWERTWFDLKTHDAICPQCHNESLIVKLSSVGSGYTEYGLSIAGTGKCSLCGWKGKYEDKSI